jgi:hypothetical protein
MALSVVKKKYYTAPLVGKLRTCYVRMTTIFKHFSGLLMYWAGFFSEQKRHVTESDPCDYDGHAMPLSMPNHVMPSVIANHVSPRYHENADFFIF